MLTLGVAALQGWAQDGGGTPPAVDVLGAHDNSGRGCAGCHTLHNDTSRTKSVTPLDGQALWGQMGTPDYGKKITLRNIGNTIEALTTNLATQDSEVTGILICLSCHDGNVTPENMMAGQSYEQKTGLIPSAGRVPIPTLLGDTMTSQYAVDHPLGVGVTINVGYGLTFTNGVFGVTPGTPYARFVESYGFPTLAPMDRSTPYGLDPLGKPYLVCTTCHNQHAMNLYTSNVSSPIRRDGGGQSYATFFYVNGPYNPGIVQADNRNSTSNVQFCRQCHFNLANEGNNSVTVPTLF